ncbi:MAG: tRNA (cytidine(34)-2'-O)-methyltransferase [Desulfovibrio sp.]|jgi:tRNA (cytidine/uridine-2'-O-)-methyltransferase|nr:tRNA (cytidine(34)-2'-O)-methyltransferase [Desulfovibrio sp.]
MRVVLFEPEIPPNTGNIVRLCAATDTELHLVEPLGFKLDDSRLKRAGLDYWPHVRVFVWPDFNSLPRDGSRLVMTSAKDGTPVHTFAFEMDDTLVFGPETRGLPQEILALSPHRTRIPMNHAHVRSLNLSTAAGIALYAALARCGMPEHFV